MYKILNFDKLKEGAFSIRPIQSQDMEPIRQWRNAQIEVLRQQQPLSAEAQQRYFLEVVEPQFSLDHPPQILFSLFENEKLIGYGGLVHISWRDKRGEMSFLVNPELAALPEEYRRAASAFINLLKKVVFEILQFNRLSTEVYGFRDQHIAILEEKGFVFEGRMRNYIYQFGKYHDSLIHSITNEEYFEKDCGLQSTHVLITSLSKKVPLIDCVRNSLQKINRRMKIFGGDSNPNCIGRYFVDNFWEMPKLQELAVNDLIKYCKDNNIHIIIPTRSEELHYFARHIDRFKSAGIFVMISREESIATCLDKLEFSYSCEKYQAIPSYKHVNDVPSEKCVVKERFGAGSISIGLSLTKQEADFHAKNLKEPIYQSFIEGQEISIDVYVSLNGNVKGIILRTRDIIVAGESQVTTTFENPALEKQLIPLIEHLDLFGHIMLQAILDKDGRLHIIECNPRFGGASTLAVKAGLDSFYWLYLESQGQDISSLPFAKSKTPLRQIRALHDHYR